MTDTRTETTSAGTTDGGDGGRSRSRAGEAYETARARTTAAYSGVRDRASRAGRRTAEEIDTRPLAAIAGGLAVGALVAAVLPGTRREKEMLGGVGERITGAARSAAQTAAEAGRQQVEDITQNAATKVGEAVISAVASTTGANVGGGDKS
jgi:ElaB/YqjD/DUF883 family membrane-anchored ribosome-binding protein